MYSKLSTVLLLFVIAFTTNLGALSSSKKFKTSSTMRNETQVLVKYLESTHYSGQPISEIEPSEFIKSYMDDLDYQHLFFMSADREKFELRYGSMIDIYLRQGTLLPAFDIFQIYKDRVTERVGWILSRLDEEFDFSTDEMYTRDRTDLDWPANPTEADALWNRRLKYELLIELLAEKKKDSDDEDENGEEVEAVEEEAEESFDEKMAKGLDKLRKRYEQMLKRVNQLEPDEVQEIYLTSLTNMYDPHSTFLSADSLEDFAIAMKNSLVGIGAILASEDGYCTIRELVPGGPADTSDLLRPDDKIVGVGQGKDGEIVDVIGLKLRKIVKLIRGEKGTEVRLLIQPGDADPSQRKEIVLVRDKIKLTATLAQAEIFNVPNGDKTIPIGVIDLPAFYGSGTPGNKQSSTTADVEQLINKLKDAGVDGLVLDLRTNGGGLLSEAVSLAGLFIPVGPVVQVRNMLGNIDEHKDKNPKVAWDGPLIVLISRYSASASEIVTGALRNHRRALIVGDQATHGKGTVQAVFEIGRTSFFHPSAPKKGAAKITIQKWYLPNGNSTQQKGVPSDITLSSVNKFLDIGEGDLPNALPWDSISPLKSYDEYALYDSKKLKDNLISHNLINELKGLSDKRQKSLEEFDYLNTNIGWFEEKNDEEKLSLNLESRRAKLKDDKVFREEMEKRHDDLLVHNFDSSEVLLDITIEKQKESELAHEGSEEEEEEEEDETFDIHLRESLRIMTDWLNKIKVGSDIKDGSKVAHKDNA